MSEEENKPTEEKTEAEVDLQEFEENPEGDSGDTDEIDAEQLKTDISAIYEVPVQVSAVLGSSSMQVSQLLKLSRGAVIELDRKVGEAIDVFVNNRLVARGEIVVVDDHLGITMTEIIKTDSAA